MLGIAREEQSNPVELKFFRGTTGANVVADATPDADRTLRLRSTVPHFSQYPYIGLGHSYKHSALLCTRNLLKIKHKASQTPTVVCKIVILYHVRNRPRLL